MQLRAKSRLLAFAPNHELTSVVRERMTEALHKQGLKVSPQTNEGDVYPTILYFDFESLSWTMSLGEVMKGKAWIYVTTPVEATNEALHHFTRSKDWSKVEAVNEMVRRCLKMLQKTGVKFEEESPNVIHKLISIVGLYTIPKELKS